MSLSVKGCVRHPLENPYVARCLKQHELVSLGHNLRRGDTVKIEDIRRTNGRLLIEQHTSTKIAELLGHQSPSTLSQVFGPNPTRAPSEKMMRRIEDVLKLPSGSTDKAAEPAPAVGADAVAEVIRLIGEIAEREGITLPPRRFADLVALAYTDTVEHGGKLREPYIRQVVRLLK